MRSWLLIGLLGAAFGADSHAQLIVAHRGASHDAPENTLAAFRLAFEQGADAIEGDFHLTADGEIICIHDQDTERVAPQSPKRIVRQTSFADLRALDVGRWKGEQHAGQQMPTLAEVLDLLPPKRQFFIEIKCGPEILPALKRTLAARGKPLEQIRLISFHEDVIVEARRQIPELKAYWLTGFKQDKETQVWTPSPREVLATLERIKADGLDCRAEPSVVDAAFVKQLRQRKLEFHCWTVDDPDIAQRMRSLGADSITTNRPAYLRDELARR